MMGIITPIRWDSGWTRLKSRAMAFDSLEEANKKFEELGLVNVDLSGVVKE